MEHITLLPSSRGQITPLPITFLSGSCKVLPDHLLDKGGFAHSSCKRQVLSDYKVSRVPALLQQRSSQVRQMSETWHPEYSQCFEKILLLTNRFKPTPQDGKLLLNRLINDVVQSFCLPSVILQSQLVRPFSKNTTRND